MTNKIEVGKIYKSRIYGNVVRVRVDKVQPKSNTVNGYTWDDEYYPQGYKYNYVLDTFLSYYELLGENQK